MDQRRAKLRVRDVDVRIFSEQRANDSFLALARRPHQRGGAVSGGMIDVCPARQQQRDERKRGPSGLLFVAVRRRVDECGSSFAISSVDISPAVHERGNARTLVLHGGTNQRGMAVCSPGLEVGASANQTGDDGDASFAGSRHQGRSAVGARSVDVRSLSQEEIDHAHPSLSGGPDEGRETVGISRVDPDARLNEQLDDVLVAARGVSYEGVGRKRNAQSIELGPSASSARSGLRGSSLHRGTGARIPDVAPERQHRDKESGRDCSSHAGYLNVTICMTQAPEVSGDVAL